MRSLLAATALVLSLACAPKPNCPVCPVCARPGANLPKAATTTGAGAATAGWWCYRFAWNDENGPGSNSECVRPEAKCRSDIEITRGQAPEFAIEECAAHPTAFCYSFTRFDGSTGDLCFMELGHCQKSITLGIGSNPTPCTERH